MALPIGRDSHHVCVLRVAHAVPLLRFMRYLGMSSTTTKESRIKEFLDVEHLPDLKEDEVRAIEEAGSGLHKRAFMHAVFGEQR